MKLKSLARLGMMLALVGQAWGLVLDPAPMQTTEAELNKLLEYQVFGEDYISADARFSPDNSMGFVGSNHKFNVGNDSKVKPTVIVNGSSANPAIFDVTIRGEFSKPVFVKGSVKLSGDGSSSFNDTLASYSDPTGYTVNGSGFRISPEAAWTTTLKNRFVDWFVPQLNTSACVSEHYSYNSGADAEVLDNATKEIDVSNIFESDGVTKDAVVDICVKNLSIGNQAKLLFKTFPGQLVRFFVTGTVTQGNGITIGMSNGSGALINSTDYKGSLVFYINGNWGIHENSIFMGSFIHNGYTAFANGISLTGQWISKGISISNDFSGSNFIYVPFNPPIVQPIVEIDGSPLSESITTSRTLKVTLDKPAIVPVSLKYQLIWGDAANGDAEATDFVSPPASALTLTIPTGGTEATFTLTVFDDNYNEGLEKFTIRLSNINGAIFPSYSSTYDVINSIIDNDDELNPTTDNSSVTFDEDNTFTFSSASFPFTDPGPGNTIFASVTVLTLPALGTLWLDANDNNVLGAGEAVAANAIIASSDLSKLKYTPVANGNGSPYTTFTFNVRDAANGISDFATMTINVTPVADSPTITTIFADTIKLEDQAFSRTVTLSDPDGVYNNVAGAFSASSSVAGLVTFSYSGTNASRTLTITPVADKNGGPTVITVSYQDPEGNSVSKTFELTITPVNDAPSYTIGSNQNVDEDAGLVSVSGWATLIQKGPSTATDESSQNIGFRLTAVNPALFTTQPAVSSTGVLTYTLAPQAFGSTKVAIRLGDNGGVANGGVANGGVDSSAIDSFTITISNINDAPSFAMGADQTVNEDSGVRTVANWATAISAGPGETETLSFTVTNNNNSLFSAQPAISSTGTLTFTPAANANGTATVSVILSDGSLISSTETFTITVNSVNDAPGYTSGSNVTVLEDAAAYSNGWASSISKGPANETSQNVAFTVTNNNAALFATAPAISSTGVLTFTLKANQNGVATVTVRFKDDGGAAIPSIDSVAARTFTITVTAVNDAPTAVTDNALTDQNTTLTATLASLLANDSDIDADALSVSEVFSPSHGTVSIVGSNYVFIPTTGYSGPASFQYSVSDGKGGLDTATVNVAVDYTNTAPTMDAIADKSIQQGSTLTVDVAAATNDVDAGDVLVYSLVTTPPPGLSLNSVTGEIDWAPTNSNVRIAPYPVTVRVTDRFDATAQTTFNITVSNLNDAPVITPISSVSVLEDAPYSHQATASDIDASVVTGTTLTYSKTSGPAWITVSTTGLISGTPSNADVGAHTITVTVVDEWDSPSSTTYTLTVTNANDAPVMVDISDCTTLEDAAFTQAVSASDSDAEDVLTYTLTTKPGTMSINASNGTISWIPANGDVGTHTVTVRVTDAIGAYDTKTFSVEVLNQNDAPVIAPITNQSTEEHASYKYQVNVTDIDQLVVEPTEALDFTLLNHPTGMQISSTGEITWIPGATDVAAHTVQVMVSDLSGASDTVSYTLTVTNVNDAPTFASIPDQTAIEDQPWTFQVSANDPDPANALTYSFVSKPSGMVINSSTGNISWNPDNDDVGNYTVTVKATDASGASVTQSFALTVQNVNDAPVVNAGSFNVSEDAEAGTYIGVVSGADVDAGTILSYELIGNTTNFIVDVDGSITLVAPLDYESAKVETLTVVVSDGEVSDTAKVIISVGNIREKSSVEIIKVVAGDSIYVKPSEVWTNDSVVTITWTKDGETVVENVTVKSGVNKIIKTYTGPSMDTQGADTVIVYVSRTEPKVEVLLPLDQPEPTPNTVVESPVDTLDPEDPLNPTGETKVLYYVNEDDETIFAQVIYIGKDMKKDTVIVKITPDLKPGVNEVEYTYTDAYGNKSTGKVLVFLDTEKPVVKILRPADSTKTTLFVLPVEWTVDGVPMDTLSQQSLTIGDNFIIRTYRDRAGNEGSDTVYVILKDNKKNIAIAMEQPLVQLNPKQIAKYYEDRAPKDDEYFALSLVNTLTSQEEETQLGKGAKTKPSDGRQPYPGLIGKHLGPTVRVEVKMPNMGGTDQAGNLRGGDIQSILEPDGRVALTAGTGEDRELVSLGEYIDEYCDADAFEGLTMDQILEAPLYKATVYLEFSIYDAIGQFVDKMKVQQIISSSRYLNDGGMLTAFVEMKPRRDGVLASQTGRSYGTGAYVIRAMVRSVSILQCDLPSAKRGDRTVYSSELLEPFGFRRSN